MLDTLLMIVGWAATGLLALKTYEVLLSVLWAAKFGRQYAADMRAALRKWNKTHFDADEVKSIWRKNKRRWGPETWPIVSMFKKSLRWTGPFGRFFINHVYRWPQLMTLTAVCLFFSKDKPWLIVNIGLVLASIFVQMTHYIVNRVQLGAMDAYFRRFNSFSVYDFREPTFEEAKLTTQDLYRDLLLMVGVLVCVLIFAFAGVYTAMFTCYSGPERAFTGVEASNIPAMQLLYFSVVSFTTVGYGDISPFCLETKAVAAFQHLVSFTLIAIVVSGYAMTSESFHAIISTDEDSLSTSETN